MTVQPPGFVILHYGSMTPTDLKAAADLLGEDAVIDTTAALMAGADFAFGAPDALRGLKERLAAGALEQEREKHPGLSDPAVRWLAHGERGMSSEAIFAHLTGVVPRGGDARRDHPHDAGDLRRCRLLLEQVPVLQLRFGEMVSVSPRWSRLVSAWPEICAAMDEESPDWRSKGGASPTANELIRRAIQGE